MKSLQITFFDHTCQAAKWSLPVNTLLFMSIHKVYTSLLIMFIKFFVIQISYHAVPFRVCKFREDFYSWGFNFAIFYNRENRELKTREIKCE